MEPTSRNPRAGDAKTFPGSGDYFLTCPECEETTVAMNATLPISFTCFACKTKWVVSLYGGQLSWWQRRNTAKE
jgi:hypothetical protein